MDMDIYVDGVGGWGRQRWLLREIKWRAPDARTRGLLFFFLLLLVRSERGDERNEAEDNPLLFFRDIYTSQSLAGTEGGRKKGRSDGVVHRQQGQRPFAADVARAAEIKRQPRRAHCEYRVAVCDVLFINFCSTATRRRRHRALYQIATSEAGIQHARTSTAE